SRRGARKGESDREPVEIPSVVPRGGDRDAHTPRPARQSRREHAGKVGGTVAKLYIGAGRKLKIRPGDIVGAIAGEANIPIAQIGAVQIGDRHSIVEVPEDKANYIIAKLSASTIKGKKVRVRRDQA
ncbi:MAG: DbpA RNA binding domain-containing protein, partial [Gemmatimonadaceae bacterium]